MQFEYPAGATPLDPDEIEGFIPLHITTQSDLNEWEEANILKADRWLFSKSNHGNFLTSEFMKNLHKKMFDETWKWAGQFRTSDKNIGVSHFHISTDLNNLLADVVYQIEHGSYPLDEIAYRFHHRLVAIHPFSNGNGRHARLMTDLLLIQMGQPRFTWGSNNLVRTSQVRDLYIAALRKADKHDYSALAEFVRS